MSDVQLNLTPTQFEHAVADLLPRLGYRDVEHVGGAGDLGADIRCRDEDGRLVVVQCKRYGPANPVSSPEMQTLFGMVVHHGAAWGLYVTTSRFTAAARKLAEERDIRLIDGEDLERYDWERWAELDKAGGDITVDDMTGSSPALARPTSGRERIKAELIAFVIVAGAVTLLWGQVWGGIAGSVVFALFFFALVRMFRDWVHPQVGLECQDDPLSHWSSGYWWRGRTGLAAFTLACGPIILPLVGTAIDSGRGVPHGVPPGAREGFVAAHESGYGDGVRFRERRTLRPDRDIPYAMNGIMLPDLERKLGRAWWDPADCYAEEAEAALRAVLPIGDTVYVEEGGAQGEVVHVWARDRTGASGAWYLVSARLVREGAALAAFPYDDENPRVETYRAEVAAKFSWYLAALSAVTRPAISAQFRPSSPLASQYRSTLLAAAEAAKQNRAGLWGACVGR